MNRPEGFHAVTPRLIVKNAREAIDLYKNLFGAKEIYSLNCPESGKIAQAQLRIDDSPLLIADENPAHGNVLSMGQQFFLYTDNVEDMHRKALELGFTEKDPVQETYRGDISCRVVDPFGNSWILAKQLREVSVSDMEEALKERKSKAA